MSLKTKIEELRKIAALHKVWLSYALLGEESISSEEFESLKKYGKLPLDKSLNLVKNSYILGRLSLLLKKAEYRDLSLDDVVEEAESAKLSSLEKFAIEHAIFGAGEGIKGLADDIIQGAFSGLSDSIGTTLTEATIRNVVRDETAIALLQKKSANKLASTLVSKLQTNWRRDWKRVAETELHRAKTLGAAQAIVNKVDIFEGSKGVDSRVSIVPSTTRCDDCAKHFIGKDGNPKIFTLKELLGAGSNADPGISHKRGADGTHSGWNSTLPPLHPTCGCKLVYIPDGMEWQAGKLVVVDKEAFSKGIKSFVAKVFGGGQKAPASTTGLAAPGNVAGPGRPASGGPHIEYDYEPVSEGKPEGPGWETTSTGRSYKRPKGMSGKGKLTKEDKALMVQAKVQDSIAHGKQDVPDDERLRTLATGKVTSVLPLHEEKDEHSGVNPSYRISVEGGGRALAKKATQWDASDTSRGILFANGLGAIVPGTEVSREVAAYNTSSGLGLNIVPVTTFKNVPVDGKEESMSAQHWLENSAGVYDDAFSDNPWDDDEPYSVSTILKSTALDKKAYMEQRMMQISTLDIIMNSNDSHMNNLVFSKNKEGQIVDVHKIDNGYSHGRGLVGHRNQIIHSFKDKGKPVKVEGKFKERLDNTSLGDCKRFSQSSGIKDWEVGHVWLRMRYVSFLQETEGHLDPEKFKATIANIDGQELPSPQGRAWNQRSTMVPVEHKDDPEAALIWLQKEYLETIAGTPNSDMLDAFVNRRMVTKAGAIEFVTRQKEGTLPNQMFESWAKAMMHDAAANPDHKDHASAKELLDLGVLVGEGHANGADEYRRLNKHKRHESSITAQYPPAQIGHSTPMASGTPPVAPNLPQEEQEEETQAFAKPA